MRFRRTAAAVLLGAGLAGVPAMTPGTATAAPGLGDPVFPELGNSGYDVSRYDLSLSYDPRTRLVAATVTIEARATAPLAVVPLDSVGAQDPRAWLDGVPAAVSQQGEKLLLRTGRWPPGTASPPGSGTGPTRG